MARAEAAATAPAGGGSLKLRILSAVVLAPLALAAVWFGSPWLPLVTAAAGAGMAWEWARLCGGGRLGAGGVVLIAAVLAAIAEAGFGHTGLALAWAFSGALAVYAAARLQRQGEPGWLALGTLWVALPCVLLLWLAGREAAGRGVLLWLFAVVWATDIGAYAFGRAVGGPLLAPRWSPRKTWAGLVGGACCAALAGGGVAAALGIPSIFTVVLLSAGLAIVEQFGDLAESVAKRRFGVKDSSGLIPGHGGLLDRLDGLLAVVPAVALLTLIGGGSVPAWR
ncbi:MAG: phosphatidate cytidylyltransferase [Thiohalocapsa sp.]